MTSRSSAVPRGPDRIPASAEKDAIGVVAGGARAGLPQSRYLESAVGIGCRCDCLRGGNQLDVLAEPTRDHGPTLLVAASPRGGTTNHSARTLNV
jgi:hypothetical protein